MSYKPNPHQHIPGTSGNQDGRSGFGEGRYVVIKSISTVQSYKPIINDFGLPSFGFSQGPNGTQAPQSKYAELLAIIEELGKEIRPTYAGSKSAMERLKRVNISNQLYCCVPKRGLIHQSYNEKETQIFHLANQIAFSGPSQPMASLGALGRWFAVIERSAAEKKRCKETCQNGRSDATSSQPGCLSMSTDDSISEDASSSVALSHNHTSPNGAKESEASVVSSTDTVSELALPEETAVIIRPSGTPACTISSKIRGLCLSGTEEEFSSGKNLPFINPSSLETLRALVHEIQSSETDPEIWKNCEGRWLNLFQLVEKQYQEQILAQQEQYQCQIQLIQDEIKALLQLQKRQNGTQSNHLGTVKIMELPVNVEHELQGSSPIKFSANVRETADDGLVTVQSSGYGTLSTWEPRSTAGTLEGKDDVLSSQKEQHGSTLYSLLAKTQVQDGVPSRTAASNNSPQTTSPSVPNLPADKQRLNSQPLTSWAQRQKHKQRKSKTAQSQSSQMKGREKRRSGGSPKEHTEHVNEFECSAVYSSPAALKRSDSLVSEASGLTYWKLEESELYRPLPESLENSSFFLIQDADRSQPLEDEAQLSVSLRDVYQSKHKDPKVQEWDSLINSDTSSPQVLTLDPGANTRQSERTSGFTSPSRFSSPSSPMSHTSPTVPRVYNKVEGSRTNTLTLQEKGSSVYEPRPNGTKLETSASLDDPVVLSLLRQKQREKHARHIADLRAYYESEISTLKEKLDLVNLPLDMERSNQILLQRCEHLERALTEASMRIRELENKNHHLERQLAAWPERYDAASSTVKALQQRLEESKQNSKEKDTTMNKLRMRLRQLEEAVQNACREVDEKEARLKNEHNMLQDVSFSYVSVTLISDHPSYNVLPIHSVYILTLKLLVDVYSLCFQLLQEYDLLRKDHEKMKDNLVSAENKLFDANEQIAELRRIISKLEAQVKQLENENMAKTRQALHSHLQPSGAGLFHHPDLLLSPSKRQRDAECGTKYQGVLETEGLGKSRLSPPESEQTHEELTRRDVPLTPVIKALIQMEDTKATEGRAVTKPHCGSPRSDHKRPTVAFVDGVREPLFERGEAVLQTQRSFSPEGHRSSSLPPKAQRAGLPSTPTKRETLLYPLSAKSSPKRCPTENVSTAFGRPMHCQQHLHNRFDLHFDQTGLSSSIPSRRNSRTRLQLMPDDKPLTSSASAHAVESSESDEVTDPDLLRHNHEDEFILSRVQSIADAEKLFDELTQEKQRIEAALSRIPGAGARVTLQTRLDQVSLENRLEKVNRDLGSIRMTLKRFHVLRSSANT
ncbi:M-phase phosphoprotein 9 [Bagarius yarrelli]|uniref:M-phase phosphoprotein 9 n=1 Tax=Bagarius yarrelli TaxID=175774 RepID=A0A556U3A7_BAGYA|nr:M-phase phosphoprotein 9 [Bagarius yarrelli]